jgi:hypothetical protein
VGRWTQADPLGGAYRFAGDDPINANDPSGLFSWDEGWDWLEGEASRVAQKAVKIVKWAINKQDERWGIKGPYSPSEVASNCEVLSVSSLFLPAGRFGKFLSVAVWNKCG